MPAAAAPTASRARAASSSGTCAEPFSARAARASVARRREADRAGGCVLDSSTAFLLVSTRPAGGLTGRMASAAQPRPDRGRSAGARVVLAEVVERPLAAGLRLAVGGGVAGRLRGLLGRALGPARSALGRA